MSMTSRALPALSGILLARSLLCDCASKSAPQGLTLNPTALLPQLQRGFAAEPYAAQKGAAPERRDLPPPWQPPPHNPVTLKPPPRPSLEKILHEIRQAQTPNQLHRAYRRNPPRLPPPIAAAKLTRLVELIKSHAPTASAAPPEQPSSQPPDQAPQQPQPQSQALATKAPLQPGPPHQVKVDKKAASRTAPVLADRPKVLELVDEIRDAWDHFLHLFPARDLAACVRAGGAVLALAATASPAAAATGAPGPPTGTNRAPQSEGSGGGRPYPRLAQAQALLASLRGSEGLMDRSLDVLLAANGRELAEAGPKAVLDVSYGLMLAGHDDDVTWRVLAPLLQKAREALPAGTTADASAGGRGAAAAAAGAVERGADVAQDPCSQADEVLAWLKGKGK